MNNRYKEIATQAANNVENRAGLGSCDMEKFMAEYTRLVVRECADIALREDHDPYECILKHFGVEE